MSTYMRNMVDRMGQALDNAGFFEDESDVDLAPEDEDQEPQNALPQALRSVTHHVPSVGRSSWRTMTNENADEDDEEAHYLNETGQLSETALAEYTRLERENEHLSRAVSDAAYMIGTLRERNRSVESELRELRRACEHLLKENDRLSQKHWDESGSATEFERVLRALETTRSDLEELKSKYETLREEHENMSNELQKEDVAPIDEAEQTWRKSLLKLGRDMASGVKGGLNALQKVLGNARDIDAIISRRLQEREAEMADVIERAQERYRVTERLLHSVRRDCLDDLKYCQSELATKDGEIQRLIARNRILRARVEMLEKGEKPDARPPRRMRAKAPAGSRARSARQRPATEQQHDDDEEPAVAEEKGADNAVARTVLLDRIQALQSELSASLTDMAEAMTDSNERGTEETSEAKTSSKQPSSAAPSQRENAPSDGSSTPPSERDGSAPSSSGAVEESRDALPQPCGEISSQQSAAQEAEPRAQRHADTGEKSKGKASEDDNLPYSPLARAEEMQRETDKLEDEA